MRARLPHTEDPSQGQTVCGACLLALTVSPSGAGGAICKQHQPASGRSRLRPGIRWRRFGTGYHRTGEAGHRPAPLPWGLLASARPVPLRCVAQYSHPGPVACISSPLLPRPFPSRPLYRMDIIPVHCLPSPRSCTHQCDAPTRATLSHSEDAASQPQRLVVTVLAWRLVLITFAEATRVRVSLARF